VAIVKKIIDKSPLKFALARNLSFMFRLFREKCSADRSWKFVLVGPGKSWKSHGN